MKRVFVTGMGVISALGNGLEANLIALQQAKSGLKPIKNLDTIHRNKWLAAEIDLDNNQLINLIPKFNSTKPSTRGQLLSIIAANEAISNADLTKKEVSEMPIIGANTVGGMDITEQYYHNYTEAHPYFFNQSHSAGETTRKIAKYLKSNAFISTINTACSSSANAIILGTRLIKSGRAKRVLVGGSDPLTKFSLSGFASLVIYDEQVCKPFDANRAGLNLGEAGAYLILESEDVIGDKDIYAEVLAYANRNDAYHASASSPDGEGAYRTMQQALNMAHLEPKDISFIHAHGTATPNNDETESIAMKRLFADEMPFFASSKSFTGHTLGAAGALNAIYAILALKHSFLFPNLNFKIPMDKDIIPVTHYQKDVVLENVLSNAFGFGGNNSSLIFGKVEKGGPDE